MATVIFHGLGYTVPLRGQDRIAQPRFLWPSNKFKLVVQVTCLETNSIFRYVSGSIYVEGILFGSLPGFICDLLSDRLFCIWQTFSVTCLRAANFSG